ncbi:hypothetical protein L9F63_006361, partial [Diploptera punctata]
KVSAQEEQNEIEDDGNWKVLYRVISDCSKKSDMGLCLKMKAVVFLDRAISLDSPLYINDYISLAKEHKAHKGRSMKQPISETNLEETLPKSEEEKNEKLDDMLQEKVDDFLHSRSLQVNFPTDVFEGRKKGKKGGYLMAGGLAMAGMMAQAFMGKIALIAGKALLVAKIALVISGIVGLKKLVGGGGGGGHDSHQVVYATGGHEHGWQRSFPDDSVDSHDLAYNAQKPVTFSDD